MELRSLIEGRGVEANLAQQVAIQLTERDPLAAHAHWELGIDPDELVNPWHAAFASMLSFIAGAIIPLVTILIAPTAIAVPATMIAVTIALALTGSTAARPNAPARSAIIRNIAEWLLAMGTPWHWPDGRQLRRIQADPARLLTRTMAPSLPIR